MSPASDENPFSARRVRPGAVSYLFGPGQDVATVVERLATANWQGQIVGPHGSGKSALVAAVIPAIEAAGGTVRLVELHDGQRRLPDEFSRPLDLSPGALLIVDGYEQLGTMARCQLSRLCRKGGWSLLVTSHTDVGLADVWQTAPSSELARRVAARLMQGFPPLVTPDDVDRAYEAHGGDLRETFFALYDVYEQRRRQPSPGGDL